MPPIDNFIDALFAKEGGYVNHRNDRGGATNFGITQKTWLLWQIQNMAKDTARDIYKALYWNKPKLDALPEDVQGLMFDMSVNHGPQAAIKILQKLVGVKADGQIGEHTIEAAENYQGNIVNDLVDARIRVYNGIVRNNPSQKVFLKGWVNRANSFRGS